jgi:alpha-beta hydrolase superfamily lysophospholipase
MATDEPFPITRPSGRVLAGTLTRPPPRADGAADARVVLLLHGMIATRDHAFAPALAAAIAARAGVAVLRFDFRGPRGDAATEPDHRFRVCGWDDDVDDVRVALAAARARALQPAAVVGHSRGAAVGVRAALPLPLALLAPRFEAAGMLKIFKALPTLDAAPSFVWPTRAGDVLVTREDVAAVHAAGTMAAPLAALPAAAPVLLVHGTADAVVPVADAARFAAARPGLRVVLLDGAKHSFDGTPAEAAALIDAVVGWLVEVLSPAAGAI